MNRYDAQLNSALRKSIGRHVIQDQGVALRIRYVGSPQSSSDYADAVLVSATSLVLSVNGVADTSFAGGSGTLAFATYTTLGTLVDQINSSPNWEAKIVGGLRSDSTGSSNLLARSTSAFKPWTTVELYWDSSVYGFLTVLLEPGEDFDSVVKANSVKSQNKSAQLHRVGFKRLICNDNNGGTAMTAVVTELKPDHASTFRTLLSVAVADNTEKDTGLQNEPKFHADFGNDLLIKFGVSGDFVDSSCYLSVEGTRE